MRCSEWRRLRVREAIGSSDQARIQGRRPPRHRQSAPSGWRFDEAGSVDCGRSYHGCHKSSRSEVGSPSRGLSTARLISRPQAIWSPRSLHKSVGEATPPSTTGTKTKRREESAPARNQGRRPPRHRQSAPRAGDLVRLGASIQQRATTVAINRADWRKYRHPADWQWRG